MNLEDDFKILEIMILNLNRKMSKETYIKIRPFMEQLMGLMDKWDFIKDMKDFTEEKKDLEKQIDSIIIIVNNHFPTILEGFELKLKEKGVKK